MANLYLTGDELEASLELTGTNHAGLDVSRCVEAASRAVDNRCGRRFWLDGAPQTIAYRPVSASYLKIDDLAEPTSVSWGSTARVEGTDYYYVPSVTSSAGDPPYGTIRPLVGAFTPGSSTPVTVVGKFGWPAIPPEVKEATAIIAAQLLRRVREAPFGVLATTFDGAAIRIGRNDPQLDMLLGPYTRSNMIE